MACCDSLVHMFSILISVTASCICFEFWLVHLIVYVFCDCSQWLLRFSKEWREERFIPTKCKAFHHWRASIWYRRMTRIWGICAKTEGGVFMYCSKPSGDHHPKNVMSQGGALLEAAVVAAPMRKLWPANSLESSPPFESKSLVSLVNLPQIRMKPDWKVNGGIEVGKKARDSK